MPEAGAGVALRVEVDHQDPVAEVGEAGAEVDRRRRLADAALLVGDGHDAGQRPGERRRPRAPAPVRRPPAAERRGRPSRPAPASARARRSAGRSGWRSTASGASTTGQVLDTGQRAPHRGGRRRRRVGGGGRRERLQLVVASGTAVRPSPFAGSDSSAREVRGIRRSLGRDARARSRWKIARPRVATSSDGSVTAASCPLHRCRAQGPDPMFHVELSTRIARGRRRSARPASVNVASSSSDGRGTGASGGIVGRSG